MITFIQDGIAQLLGILDIDEANLKILICALLSFPFSFLFKRLPDRNYTLKNVYNIAVSAFYVFGILNLYSGLMTLLILSLGCYFITRYLRTSSMPWVNFLFLMGHLAYNHVSEQFFNSYDPTKIDITGAQMVLVMKLSAFGWNIHDGKQPVALLTPYARERMLKKHPNILPYIGYVFFYASLLTGPAFDYADYDKFIHSTLFDDVPEDKRPGKTKRRIPRSGKESLRKTLQGFFWAFLFANSSKYVSLDYVLSGKLVAEHNFFYRIFYLWILGFSHRLKYYTIWSIAEGSCILSGIGYNGVDPETGKFRWNRVQNIDPYAFETGQNCKVCLESWNMNTNKWLKNYVYLRIARKDKGPGVKSTLFTFATSAFWHGTRPGYYLSFVLGAFFQTVGKIYRRNFRPIFLEKDGKTAKPSKKYYDIVCYFVTQLSFGYIVQPFVVLDLKQSLYVWSTCYFYLHIGIIVTFFVFRGPFAKDVVKWLRSFQDQPAEKTVRPSPKNKLNSQESGIVKSAVETMLDKEINDDSVLGVPSIEVLETVNREDIDQEIKELGEAWRSFRGRRTSIAQDDFEGLKDAYNNFTNEINDIFVTKKNETLVKKGLKKPTN
ncbi:MBOAT-domain-containing protein [Suhomyces tanzawaensis NRRL Y-17324]|uniref:MBOAT-domain-containing protein n=1 Tax=Suhomyces tanzawaensis NRRL Y-17324 TaxID=984487 RepID=A0A1E4SKW2_9ASCO|nr:MBOAT-domain-containing protein [Suhomyces tanzawaensis NRRL Y-17324]ODV80155.1 MBOAT-domain-containing protein [Suhomyces tanzawaensis NRRL Y-17324]